MKTIIQCILLYSIAILFSNCSRNHGNKLPIVDIYGREVANLNLLNLKDNSNVKLTQIAENINLVALETKQECTIPGDFFFYVGRKYIIAQGASGGAYQFSIDGTYIRKLFNHGNGPGEIPSSIPYCSLIEDEDLFLAATRDHVYQYQLSTGNFIGTIGKPILKPREQINSLTYVRDSIILFSYFNTGTRNNDLPADSLGCGIKLQKLDGKILWQKYFKYSSWIFHPVMKVGLFTGSYIYILTTDDPDEFIIQINDHDTVYKLNTNTYSLIPSLLRKSEIQEKDGFPVDRVVANCFIENYEYASSNGYQLMRFEYVTEEPAGWDYDVDLYYILYDDNNQYAYRIGTYENDFLGFIYNIVDNKEISYKNLPYLLNPLGLLIERYDAYELLNNAKEALNRPGLNEKVKDRLLELTNTITENSNPILVIGEIKKSIEF